MNEAAASGFGTPDLAAAYERARPGYPAAAIDLLVERFGIGPGTTVVDLAAGTGKLTRQLVPTGATVVAVEPLASMREQLVALVPGVEALDGTAEAIPLGEGSVDVVTVGQAFHWFRADAALAELARVLRPGGGLALLWNERDETVPWVAEMTRITQWDRRMPYDPRTDWAALVAASDEFTPLEHAQLRHEQTVDADGLVARALSSSYLAVAPAEEQAGIAAALRSLVAGFESPFPLPYVTDVFTCRRNP